MPVVGIQGLGSSAVDARPWNPRSWILGIGSVSLDPWPWIHATHAWGAKALDPMALVQALDLGPWMDTGPGSMGSNALETMALESRALDPGPWIQGLGSRALDPGYRDLNPWAWIQQSLGSRAE